MGRLGVRDREELCALITLARELPCVRLEGLYTHLACADAPGDDYTREQQRRFEDLTHGLGEGLTLHAANSAGALRYPSLWYGAVRAGIALYGCPGVETALPLRPAQRWTCRATLVKTLPPGEGVSYGAAFRTGRETRVMTLPVGYGDGYRRMLSGRAWVLVRGRRAPLIGRVCMDQCMADVTEIPGAAPGDEVVLLGTQREERISPEEMAAWLETIPYEVMLAPTARVPRVYQGDPDA